MKQHGHCPRTACRHDKLHVHDKQTHAHAPHAGVVKEIAIMRTLEEHPNTVKLVDVYDQADTFVLVMELCSGELS